MAGASVFGAYQTECRVALGRMAYLKQTTSIQLTGSARSEYVPIAPKNGANALGIFVESVVSLTAGSAQTATATITVGPTTTPTDILDESILNLFILPAPSTSPRSTWLSRLTLEESERLILNLRQLSYPRAAPANFVGAGSRTDTAGIFVPVGGAAAALQIQPPNITNTYAANVTGTVVYNIYVVSGDNATVTTYQDVQTPSLGAAKQDLGTWFPANMSPSFLILANETTSTVTAIFVTAQDSTILLDFETITPIAMAQAAIVPDTTTSYSVLDFTLSQKRFQTFFLTVATSGPRLLGFLEFTGTQVTNPTTSTAPAPGDPGLFPSRCSDRGRNGSGGNLNWR